MSAVTAMATRSAVSVARDYVSLLKLRIVMLLDATAVGVMIPAAHGHPRLTAVLAVFVGGTLAAGGAHAVNCWFDRDIDAEMSRTRRRPLPAGRIPPWHALAIGITLNVLAFVVLWAYANLLAAALALTGTLIYVVVYTIWLKRSTPQNIVIGGAAGAIPPLVGWAAATGHLDATAFALFGVIFFWTPPHFWALALYRRLEYAKAGVPMLPVTHGDKFTRLHVLFYTVILVAVTLLPFATRMSGLIYIMSAVVLDAVFLYYAIKIYRAYSDRLAQTTFRYSIVYLTLIFSALLIDHYFTF